MKRTDHLHYIRYPKMRCLRHFLNWCKYHYPDSLAIHSCTTAYTTFKGDTGYGIQNMILVELIVIIQCIVEYGFEYL